MRRSQPSDFIEGHFFLQQGIEFLAFYSVTLIALRRLAPIWEAKVEDLIYVRRRM